MDIFKIYSQYVTAFLLFCQGEASPCAAMCSPAAARIRRYPLEKQHSIEVLLLHEVCMSSKNAGAYLPQADSAGQGAPYAKGIGAFTQ